MPIGANNKEESIMCSFCNGNNWWWIIILILLAGGFSNNGCGCGCGCDNGCSNNNNNNPCGCGCNYALISKAAHAAGELSPARMGGGKPVEAENPAGTTA